MRGTISNGPSNGALGGARKAMIGLVSVIVSCGGPPPVPEWNDEDGYRWRELVVPRRGSDGFTALRPSRTGIEFANQLRDEVALDNDHLLIGSGVTLGDVDGDGLVDVYLSRLEGPNALYRNLGGWKFEDITEAAGVSAPDRYSTGAVLADVDGDSDLDLLTTALGGPNALFLNDGSGVFREATEEAGLTSELGSTTMTLADVDGDGDVDLYVANYKVESAADVLRPYERQGMRLVEGRGEDARVAPEFRDHFRLEMRDGRSVATEQAEPDRLYLNDGLGHFEPVSWTSGRFLDQEGRPLLLDVDDFALAARFYDVDGDGDPDLYVCDDFDDPDHFWINDGSGVFRAAPALALRTTSNASMAVDFADIDRDGDVDFFVADMLSRDRARRLSQRALHRVFPKAIGAIYNRPQFQRNTLFMNRGDRTFAQVSELAGVDASEWSWGTLFLDVDLDGYEDLLIANGHSRDMQNADALERITSLRGRTTWRDAKMLYPDLPSANVAFRNRGDLTFEEVGEAWGFGVEDDVSHGLAAGDLDGDGDVDLVVNRLGMPAAVLRNNSTKARVAVRLAGSAPNTQGVGAKVKLIGGALPEQAKEITLGGIYLSGSDPQVTFAADGGGEMRLVVEWRGGRRSVVEGVLPDRLYQIEEASAEEPEAEAAGPTAGAAAASPETESAGAGAPTPGGRGPGAPPAPYFVDVSSELGHTHVETDFDDFQRQPLLPNLLSRLGPGVTWTDLDRDGDPDLIIPSGSGGHLAYFRNDAGRLTERPLGDQMPLADRTAAFDQTVALPIPDGQGGLSLLVGQAVYEATTPERAGETPSSFLISPNAPSPAGATEPSALLAAIPGYLGSVGPLALADYDRDGDLDLFVGGRVVPAGYPLPVRSRLFLRDGDGFRLDEANQPLLSELGLASSAVFSDIDGDGDPDLLVAVEWGPIRLFLNEAGRFSEATEAYGLAEHLSRWNGVTTGDLDGDGRLDVIATSWGRNTRERPAPDRPLLLYHADFDKNGTWDPVLAQRHGREIFPLARLERLRRALPAVRSRLPDFASYSRASLDEVLGVDLDLDVVWRLEANTMDQTVFFNRGGSFEAVPLPREAQLAPAFHAGVADFDGDGHEDLFLSQNFFPTEIATARQDGGRALWLRGDGTGALVPVPGQVSGIAVYGDQRGAAMADYDRDGRIDLVVAQNGAETKLYRNQGAKPGLRIRLEGPDGNPLAIGAWVRVVYGDDRGPVREIHAGSGYWSMDDAVQVMGLRAEPTGVWVRWPDGSEAVEPVEEGQREVTVRVPQG